MPYYYCVVKTKLKENEDKQVVLDLLFPIYSQYIMNGNKDVTYSGRVAGMDVLALIAVKDYDEEKAKKFIGWIGDEWDKVKIDAKYTDVYTVKVKDVKKVVDELGKVTEYVDADKDEPVKFSQWCEKPKEEIEKEDIDAKL